MSIIFRDPFFDNFDDILVSTFPKQHDLDSWFNDGIRRDVITPFSGFGRMDMKENEKDEEVGGMKRTRRKRIYPGSLPLSGRESGGIFSWAEYTFSGFSFTL